MSLINRGFVREADLASAESGKGAEMVALEDGRNLQQFADERVTFERFGATGDGVADDSAAIVLAAYYANSFGSTVYGTPGKNYRITLGVVLAAENAVFDLNNSVITADFDTGNAITVGNNLVLGGLGVRNGRITTARTSTALNGVVFKKNVRRNVQYGGLHIKGFKGIGLQFEELNWSIQAKDAPIIEQCGINLDINDNGNAITIAGAALDGATTYNARLRGTVAVTFVGGYNQFAGLAGILLDTGTLGATQQSVNTSVFGTYFEGNGTSHIVGNNGKGLTINGAFFNCGGMTGAAVDLNGWTGAEISGNTPQNTSGRDFVHADAASSLIRVGRQAVTSVADVTIGGSMNAYVSDDFPVSVSALPAASLLNLGSRFLLSGTGTGANRTMPYVCTQIASGSRAFRRMALQPRKQNAVAVTSPYTPNIGSIECFDMTLPAGGLLMNAPTGPYEDGDEIIFLLRQASSPTAGVTWDAVFKTDLSSTLLANSYGSVTFRWSAGRSLWIQTAKMEWKA